MREEKTKNKRKPLIIVISIIVVIALGITSYFLFFRKQSGESVFVMSLSEITGKGTGYFSNRFMGVVESQEVKEINIENGREVDEIFVEIGDSVKVGDIIFSYTTIDIERRMLQANIEIEGMRNSINSSYTEIGALREEQAQAPPENQIDYTLQIQSLLANISQTEYSIKAKQIEYDQLKKSLDNSVVKAPIAGTIQSINDPNEMDPYTGMNLPFIVIMKGGDFVVRGTVSELNVFSLYEGARVIIRSRINEEQIWLGNISLVDTSKTQDDNSNGMYYSYGGQTEGASKYNFYVELDSILGLMIGQHVTIELDEGLGDSSNEGLWLSSWYINDLETNPYVWAENSRGKIEIRRITLGAYDENMDSYEVLEGLTYDDYIAYPDITIKAGMSTVKEMQISEMNSSMIMNSEESFTVSENQKIIIDKSGQK